LSKIAICESCLPIGNLLANISVRPGHYPKRANLAEVLWTFKQVALTERLDGRFTQASPSETLVPARASKSTLPTFEV